MKGELFGNQACNIAVLVRSHHFHELDFQTQQAAVFNERAVLKPSALPVQQQTAAKKSQQLAAEQSGAFRGRYFPEEVRDTKPELKGELILDFCLPGDQRRDST